MLPVFWLIWISKRGEHNLCALSRCMSLYDFVISLEESGARVRDSDASDDASFERSRLEHVNHLLSLQKEGLEQLVRHLTQKGTPLFCTGADFSKHFWPVPREAVAGFPLAEKLRLTRILLHYMKRHRSELIASERASRPDFDAAAFDAVIRPMEEFLQLRSEAERRVFVKKIWAMFHQIGAC